MRRILAIAVLSAALAARSAPAETPCDLQGAWQLVSAKYDNQPPPSTYSSVKVFTKTRFAFFGYDTTLHGPLLSDADRLKFFSGMNAGGGTYVVSSGAWTEKIDQFSDPAYIGLSITFQCVHEGDRLIQKGTLPIFDGGKKVRDISLEEVYRRLDRP